MTTDAKSFGKALGRRLMPSGSRGFTLIEILVTLAIFTIILGGFFSAYLTQLKHTTRETKGAEAEIELGIAKGVLLRDLELAGYGLADDYSAVTPTTFAPLAARASDGTPPASDTLTLTGTALSLKNRAAQEWSYMSAAASPATFASWNDVREDVADGDRVILMEPSTKKLLVAGTSSDNWLFRFNGTNSDPTTPPSASPGTTLASPAIGTLVYALYGAPASNEATQPYWTVRYYIGTGDPPVGCAAGSNSLLRAETDQADTPNPDHGNPLLACVLDMEVSFGLDTNEDGVLEWDNGGASTAGYTEEKLRKDLKEVKLYLLVQSGSRDRDYTFPNGSILVGEDRAGVIIGRSVDLTAEQRHYRWRMVTITKTLRNLR